jgi:hypothetical protein
MLVINVNFALSEFIVILFKFLNILNFVLLKNKFLDLIVRYLVFVYFSAANILNCIRNKRIIDEDGMNCISNL